MFRRVRVVSARQWFGTDLSWATLPCHKRLGRPDFRPRYMALVVPSNNRNALHVGVTPQCRQVRRVRRDRVV